MDIFQGEIDKNGCNLSHKGTKMGPEVLYCCWVLLSSPGVNNSLSTIFFGTPCILMVLTVRISWPCSHHSTAIRNSWPWSLILTLISQHFVKIDISINFDNDIDNKKQLTLVRWLLSTLILPNWKLSYLHYIDIYNDIDDKKLLTFDLGSLALPHFNFAKLDVKFFSMTSFSRSKYHHWL